MTNTVCDKIILFPFIATISAPLHIVMSFFFCQFHCEFFAQKKRLLLFVRCFHASSILFVANFKRCRHFLPSRYDGLLYDLLLLRPLYTFDFSFPRRFSETRQSERDREEEMEKKQTSDKNTEREQNTQRTINNQACATTQRERR